jgi:hypothetical protein
MTASTPRETAAAERRASTLRKAARTHERALVVELWAVEYFQRRGEMPAAERHQAACIREAASVEHCYTLLDQAAAELREAPARG